MEESRKRRGEFWWVSGGPPYQGEVGLAGGSFACVDRDWLARQKAMQELGLQGPGAVGGRRDSGEGHFAPGTSLPILTKTSLGRYLVLGVAVRES
jgi:hypothetical protein